MHADVQIVPLGIRRGNVLHVGIAFNPFLTSTDAFRGAIAALDALGSFAVELHKHRVINVGTERAFNGLQVGLMAVAGKLNAIGEP